MENGMFGIDVTRHAVQSVPEALEDAPGVERKASRSQQAESGAQPVREDGRALVIGRAVRSGKRIPVREGVQISSPDKENGGLEHE